MRSGLKVGMIAVAATLLLYGVSSAATIRSPTSATASSEFSADFDIGNTIDQSGLSVGFTSGVTDFDTYMALSPLHDWDATDKEWFTSGSLNGEPGDVLMADVTYDLGATYRVSRLALWNEESSGIGSTDILSSVDGITYSLVTTILPTDHDPGNADYGADVFGLGAIARYLRFEISDCPQTDSDFFACAMGEVAFDTALVPLPASLPLFALGMAGLGLIGWRRRRRVDLQG